MGLLPRFLACVLFAEEAKDHEGPLDGPGPLQNTSLHDILEGFEDPGS